VIGFGIVLGLFIVIFTQTHKAKIISMRKFKSVLLVDDDPTINFVHKLFLTEWEVTDQIYTAANGQEALDFLEQSDDFGQEPPSMILLDINMPVMNGFEFLEAYESLPESKKASVIMAMLTTSLHEKDREKASQFISLDSYMSKPLEKEQLMKVINNYWMEMEQKEKAL